MKTFLLILVSLCFAFNATAQPPELKSGFISTSDGVRIHYLESGQGPAMLFVPGLTMSGEIWDSQIKYFAKNHRVVAMDPRSQGESQKVTQGHFPERRAKDINEMVDALHLAPVVLVAWSMGGTEALVYVDQFGSDALRSLVLVDSTVGGETDAARTAANLRNVKALQEDRVSWTDTWIRSMFSKPQPDEYLKKLFDASMETPTDTMALLILNTYVVSGEDRRYALRKIKRPVLYVARADNAGQVRVVRTTLPAAQVEVFEKSGHALFVEDPERFNKLVDEFIAHN